MQCARTPILLQSLPCASYAADGGCLDNDDGSSYYDIFSNFCVYGGHKGDFDGNSKRSFGNIAVYPTVCVRFARPSSSTRVRVSVAAGSKGAPTPHPPPQPPPPKPAPRGKPPPHTNCANRYGTRCVGITAQGLPPAGYAEAYFNNTCILPDANSNYLQVCAERRRLFVRRTAAASATTSTTFARSRCPTTA